MNEPEIVYVRTSKSKDSTAQKAIEHVDRGLAFERAQVSRAVPTNSDQKRAA
ncbi:hypothetical protein Sinme_0788 [Sinorhizobium meliloti AK83]|nr:hypothetical protein Sinme_0788 [Sinorhizobium meliloti AK83]SEJ02318.1 hypothetical protein SAMN04244575_02760 [Sinorhizobium meliloti]